MTILYIVKPTRNYAFSENRVIDGIEFEGLEFWNVITDQAKDYGRSALDLYTESIHRFNVLD